MNAPLALMPQNRCVDNISAEGSSADVQGLNLQLRLCLYPFVRLTPSYHVQRGESGSVQRLKQKISAQLKRMVTPRFFLLAYFGQHDGRFVAVAR
jgi:hypothetical protein